jgi:hypothetical protein
MIIRGVVFKSPIFLCIFSFSEKHAPRYFATTEMMSFPAPSELVEVFMPGVQRINVKGVKKAAARLSPVTVIDELEDEISGN